MLGLELMGWGVDEETAYLAALVVNELVTNVVEHAGTATALSVRRQGATMVIGVGDGCADEPAARGTAVVGLGLTLVDQCVSARWCVAGPDPGRGKTVWVEMPITLIDSELTG